MKKLMVTFIVSIVICGCNTAEPQKINALKFRELVRNGEVSKYVLINNKNEVWVYLTTASVVKYRDEMPERGPQMSFKIIGSEAFVKEMTDFYNTNAHVEQVPWEIHNVRD